MVDRHFLLTGYAGMYPFRDMKMISFPIITMSVILSLVSVPASARVTTQAVTMHSKALDKETTYIAALPDPLVSGKKYPVLYLLHGATGNYRDWIDKTTVTQALENRDMIVVMPDGDRYSWYLDSPVKSESRYDMAISRDLVNDVDSRFPTISDRSGRGIAGLSMGGHGALSLAAKHPEVYSSASSMSGILNVSDHPGKWGLNDILGLQPESLMNWRSNSVLFLADRFTTADVALLFDTGVGDNTGAVEDNRRTHEALANRKIAHLYREFPGIHDWKYWGGHIDEHLEFHDDNFTTRAAGFKPLTGRQEEGPARYTTATLSYERENREWTEGNRGMTSPTIVLLGSSTFAGTTSTLFSDYRVANRGIGADRLGIDDIGFGLLHRLYCSVFDVKADAILINNGTNDLYHTAATGKPTVEQAAAGMELIVKRIREELTTTPIIIVSCHATRDKSAQIAPFIMPYNELTRTLTEKYSDVYYVDTYSPTVGEDGLLKVEYSRDGLHLNAAGYELLGQLCNEALKKAGVRSQIQLPHTE